MFKEEARHLWTLSWPIILAQLSQVLFGLVDTVMVGRVSTTDLAAAAFSNSIFFIVSMFCFGFCNSTSPVVARALGAKNRMLAGLALTHSLLLSFLVGLFLLALLLVVVLFMDQFGQSPDVVVKSKGFFTLLSLSLIPLLIFQVYKQFCEAIEKPKIPLVITLAAVGLNAALNHILIFGNYGFPRLELLGAGYATLVARILMVFAIVAYVHRSRLPKSFIVPWEWRPKLFRELWRIGFPSGCMLIFEVGAFSSSSIMMGWIGVVPLAAHQIVLTVASMTFMVPLGLSFGAVIRVGHAVGQKNYRQAKAIAQAAYGFTLLFMMPTALLFICFSHFWGTLFTQDREVIGLTLSLFVVAGIFQIFDGLQAISVGLLRALKDVRVPLIATFTAYWLIALPSGYILTFKYGVGPVGIWIGLALGLLTAALFLVSRFYILIGQQKRV